MAIKITSTKGYGTGGVKALIYGDSEVGKTFLCSTAPAPIIISAEALLLPLRDLDIPIIEVTKIAEVFEALEFFSVSQEAKKYKTVCLDSITEIAEICLSQYKEEEKDPRNAYGRLADDIFKLLRRFRDLENINVCFNAKMVKSEDNLGAITYRPHMPGKLLSTGVPYLFNEMFAMRLGRLKDGTLYRYLQTSDDMMYLGKDKSGKLNAIEEPNLAKIFNKISNLNSKENV